jgi:hypothetical protein
MAGRRVIDDSKLLLSCQRDEGPALIESDVSIVQVRQSPVLIETHHASLIALSENSMNEDPEIIFFLLPSYLKSDLMPCV